MKLLTAGTGLDLKTFNDKTGYTIMFGPDKCGLTSKLHFIIRYKNPISGEIKVWQDYDVFFLIYYCEEASF